MIRRIRRKILSRPQSTQVRWIRASKCAITILSSPHFLDAQKYPTITFHSKSAKVAGPGKLLITGDLTIHGVTKEVVLDVDGPSGPIADRAGQRMGASATTKIKRQDFGVTYGSGVVGDEITITIDVEMIQPQPAK